MNKYLIGVLVFLVGLSLVSSAVEDIADLTYNTNTEEAFNGKIIKISQVPSRKKDWCFVHLTLDNDFEIIAAHLGPAWYVTGIEKKLRLDMKVDVIGSRVTCNDEDILLLRTIQWEAGKMDLRDENGLPLWWEPGGITDDAACELC